MTTRRSFSDKFKAMVALEALRADKTAQEIAAKHKFHSTQVTAWKRQAIDGLTGVFSDKVRKACWCRFRMDFRIRMTRGEQHAAAQYPEVFTPLISHIKAL
jgi:transposase